MNSFKNLIKIYFFVILYFLGISLANADFYNFENTNQEHRFNNLLQELRCVKCQNSNLAESDASIAQDLRAKVYQQMIEQNMTDKEIKDWLVSRYGNFVLYEPPIQANTIILWLLPFLLIIFGFFLFSRHLKIKNKDKKLSEEQQQNVDKVLS